MRFIYCTRAIYSSLGVGLSQKCAMRSAMFFELPDLVSSRVAVLMNFVQPRLLAQKKTTPSTWDWDLDLGLEARDWDFDLEPGIEIRSVMLGLGI